MTIDIPHSTAERLRIVALMHGVSIESYALKALDAFVPTLDRPKSDVSYDVWKTRFEEFRKSRRSDLPILSDQAISRESIYDGR